MSKALIKFPLDKLRLFLNSWASIRHEFRANSVGGLFATPTMAGIMRYRAKFVNVWCQILCLATNLLCFDHICTQAL